MARLAIFLLGPPELTWDTDTFSLPGPRNRALLYRLAVEEGPVPQEHIGYLFGPCGVSKNGLQHVGQLCADLCSVLPDAACLVVADGRVGLDPALVETDVGQFRRLARLASRQPTIPLLTRLTNLYRGPLLANFALPVYPRFGVWSDLARHFWEQDYLSALQTLIEQAIAERDYPLAIATVHRFLAVDAADEAMHACLIDLYNRSGDPAAAQKQYAACVHELRRRHGRQPRESTNAILQRTLECPLSEAAFCPPRRRQFSFLEDRSRRRQWQDQPKARRQKLVLS